MIPTTCQHPGCNSELPTFEFAGNRSIPGSPYCDDHVGLYQPSQMLKKDLGQKIAEHNSMWGKYASYDPSLVPLRVIRYHEKGAKHGIVVDERQAIELIHSSGKGCILQGDTGFGKTYFLFNLSNFLLRETGRSPLFCYSPQLHYDLADAARSDDAGARSRMIAKLTTAGRLFIDDIGSSNWTDSFEEAFKLIIESRSKNGLATFTSLQQTSEEFINKPTSTSKGSATWKRRDAILRRLIDDCLIFKFTAQ